MYFCRLCVCLFVLTASSHPGSGYGDVLTPLQFGGKNQALKARIIGGFEARKEDLPSVCFLIVKTYATDGIVQEFLCGFSLLSSTAGVTAAHCVYQAEFVDIICGVSNMEDTKNAYVATVNASRIYTHPEYNPTDLKQDVALIKLVVPVIFNSKMKPIGRPCNSEVTNYDGMIATVCGWGVYAPGGKEQSKKLLQATVNVMAHQACREVLREKKYELSEAQMCTLSDSSATCYGDSGSAMLYLTKYGVQCQVGVVSFVLSRNCDPTVPRGFMFIPAVNDWITQITGIPCGCNTKIYY